MIRYQLPSVKQAYEPWLYSERMMFLDGSRDNPILAEMPDANNDLWIWAFQFDCGTTLVNVSVVNYVSLHEARRDLIERLMNHTKVLNVGGFTDVITESVYQMMATIAQNDEWGVNSHSDLQGDVRDDL